MTWSNVVSLDAQRRLQDRLKAEHRRRRAAGVIHQARVKAAEGSEFWSKRLADEAAHAAEQSNVVRLRPDEDGPEAA